MKCKYPTVALYLGDSAHAVEAWSVDDLTKLFKQVQDAIQKMDVTMAKDKKGFWNQHEQTQKLDEIKRLLGRISNQLNRLLGVST